VKRSAFTLIELMVSIVILSILMLFLYKSYDMLNRSNTFIGKEVETISKEYLLKKTLYLDFATAIKKSITILNQDQQSDILFLQSKHSLHKRVNPYVAYIFKENRLYRLESLKPFVEYPLTADSEFIADNLGEAEIFRVYKSKTKNSRVYLLHILFKNKKEVLLKVKQLNGL
jgi:prepilin-type N-terminal cleavage/methylation domain-containing protein